MQQRENEGGTGRCLCGAVTYRFEGRPSSVGLCQCERGQRQSGSAFLIGVVFPMEAVTIEGALSTFESREPGEGAQRRHFCSTCGSAASITLDRYPQIRSMMGGILDDKSNLRPSFSIWCSSGQPWLSLPANITCHADYPDGTFGQ